MEYFARELGSRGLRVIRFQFLYMTAWRRDGRRRPPEREAALLRRWNEVIDRVQVEGVGTNRLVIGGKSLGGRMASLIADTRTVAGLVCLGYPFHPPGKTATSRVQHLESLRTPTLICQGTRDPFGKPEEVRHYRLAAGVQIAWIEDGEHSFKPRKQSGRTWQQNLQQAADAVVEFTQNVTEI
jgi:predicted alpha/beta-hydrolase family hydrolase